MNVHMYITYICNTISGKRYHEAEKKAGRFGGRKGRDKCCNYIKSLKF